MGTTMGFEPTTLGTTIRCSNQLSYDVHIPKELDCKDRILFEIAKLTFTA